MASLTRGLIQNSTFYVSSLSWTLSTNFFYFFIFTFFYVSSLFIYTVRRQLASFLLSLVLLIRVHTH